MLDTKPLGIRADDRYRSVEEAQIVELLLLCGWACELRHGGRIAAEREARAALDRWTGLGLPFAQGAGGSRRFDPAEVINFLKWAGARHDDPFWEERFVANGRRLVRGFHFGTDAAAVPPSPAVLGPERFAVTLSREFDVRHIDPGARIVLRMPLPLEDDALRNLDIAHLAPSDIDVEFTVAPGRLDARLPAPRDRKVALGVCVTFTAYPCSPGPGNEQLAREDFDLYTRPREGIMAVSPRIRALAATLAADARDPRTAVQRFWDFLLDELTCGVVRYDELDAARPTDHVLESGWFDCQLGSALLVALCRARGIPARLLGGYLLYPASPSYHFWAEVWLADHGWFPVDSICADLSMRGRDAAWRNYFLGCLDYRMKTQCLPRLFDRSPSIQLPPAWHMLARADGDTTEIGIHASGSGALVYRDRISVRRAAESSGVPSEPTASLQE